MEGCFSEGGAKKMERKTGFEPATTTLARWGSTGLSYFRSQLDLSVLRQGF